MLKIFPDSFSVVACKLFVYMSITTWHSEIVRKCNHQTMKKPSFNPKKLCTVNDYCVVQLTLCYANRIFYLLTFMFTLEALLREVGHQYLVVKTSKVNLLSGTKKVCSVYDFLTLACKFLSGHLKTISDFLLFINCGMIFHSKSSHIL